MKKAPVKQYDLTLKNLKDQPLAVAKSILPALSSGKVSFKGEDQVRLAKLLQQNGSVEILNGLTDEVRSLFGWGIQTNDSVVLAEVKVDESLVVEATVQHSELPNQTHIALTIEQIDTMTREEMIEFARKVDGLDIGRRTPLDVAQARLKAFFGYEVTE